MTLTSVSLPNGVDAANSFSAGIGGDAMALGGVGGRGADCNIVGTDGAPGGDGMASGAPAGSSSHGADGAAGASDDAGGRGGDGGHGIDNDPVRCQSFGGHGAPGGHAGNGLAGDGGNGGDGLCVVDFNAIPLGLGGNGGPGGDSLIGDGGNGGNAGCQNGHAGAIRARPPLQRHARRRLLNDTSPHPIAPLLAGFRQKTLSRGVRVLRSSRYATDDAPPSVRQPRFLTSSQTNEVVTMKQTTTIRTLSFTTALLAAIVGTGCVTDPAETSPSPPEDDDDDVVMPMDCEIADWNITTDTILYKQCSPYAVSGSATVSDGATLSIEAGVELRFDDGEWLEVGDGSDARLEALGTADDPIVFTSTHPNTADRGAWHGLFFRAQTLADSRLEHVVVRYAGRTGFGVRGCITVAGAGDAVLSLANVTMEDCEQAGLAVDAGAVAATGLAFANSDAGLSLAARNVGDIDEAFSYDNVSRNLIDGESMAADHTWVAQPIPYDVNGSLHVVGAASPTLTLSPGLHLRFSDGEWLEIGDGDDGALVVNGTPEAPVLMESRTEGAGRGAWHGVVFRSDSRASSLDHLIIRDAGRVGFGVRGCITMHNTQNNRVAIENSTFEQCEQAGLATHGPTATLTAFNGNTFRDSDSGMWLNANTVGSVAGPQTFENVPENRVQGDVVNTSATWSSQPVPYRVHGSVSVDGSSLPVVTMLAGLTLQFADGEWLEVGESLGGGLIVAGTAASPVVMQSENAAPAAGDWHGLFLRDQTLAATTIDHLMIEHAGRAGFGVRGAITLSDTQDRVEITNTTMSENAQADVYVDCQSAPALSDNDYNSAGLVMEGGC